MRGRIRPAYLALIAFGLAVWARPDALAFGGKRPGRVLFERGTAVYFQADQEWEEVEPVQGDALRLDGMGLVVTGVELVEFMGKVYPLRREGLYRFVKFPSGVTNLIARKDKDSLMPVLKSLSQLHVHGKRHDALEDAAAKLRTMPWVIQTCGPGRNLAYTVLRKEAGFWPRSIDTLTGEKLSGFDDGHSLLEVYDPRLKQRVLADTDMGYMFEKEGRFLSTLDLWRLIRKGEDFDLVRLARVEIDPEFPLAVYGRLQAATPERVKDWYRRVFQIIAIDGDALIPDEAVRKRVTEIWGRSAIKTGEAEWVQKYYRAVE